MLNVGLDKFLANATKSLEKMEFEMRDFQVGMIDRGIDRLTNLLIYSFYGLDKDKSRSLEGEELNHFFSIHCATLTCGKPWFHNKCNKASN